MVTNPKNIETMKKNKIFLKMAALAVVGTMMSGCAEEINTLQTANQTVIQKISISLADNAGTRGAISSSDGTTTFLSNDKIAVIYQNTNGKTVKAESFALTSTDISDNGASATFSVEINSPLAGGYVRYIYPASMAAAETDIVPEEVPSQPTSINEMALATQDGTLETIASSLGLAVYDGTMSATATLPTGTGVELKNQLAIGKFTIKNGGGDDITNTITSLSINDGYSTYTITTTTPLSTFYVAMQPVSSSQTVKVNATDGTKNYYKSVTGNTLAANNIYAITVGYIEYLKWDAGTQALKPTPLPETYKTMTASETTWSGTYVVDQDVEIAADVTLGGDVDLIILDGKTLSVATNKVILYAEETNTLNIYGQSEGSDAGKLVVSVLGQSSSSTYGTLNIHSGIVNANSTTVTSDCDAIEVKNLNIYGGTVVAEGKVVGICVFGDLKIYGGDVTATSTGNESNYSGIYCSRDLDITGGKVYAKGGDATATTLDFGGFGIKFSGTLTIDGTADVTAIGGAGYNNSGTWTNGGDGVYGYGTTTTIDIKGGELKASSGYGKDAIYLNGNMTISGSSTKVTATGGSNGTGIHVTGKLTIYDGDVKAYGGGKGTASGSVFGLEGTINIKGGKVTVEGKNAAASSNEAGGIAITGAVYMDGGTLKATGGNGDGTGNGGHALDSRLYISGGSVEVTAGNGGSNGNGGSGIANGSEIAIVYSGGSVIAMGGSGTQEGNGIDNGGGDGSKIRNDKTSDITYYTYDGTTWDSGTSLGAGDTTPTVITAYGVKIEE